MSDEVAFDAPPAQRLDPRALILWRMVAGLWAVAGAAAALGGVIAVVALDGPLILALLPALAVVVLGAVGILVAPRAAYSRWRYDIDDQEIDLQRGWIWLERTLVPMARVQHVETEHGPLQRRLGLATVRVHTAAGSFDIPALDEHEAAGLRSRIAELANLTDDV